MEVSLYNIVINKDNSTLVIFNTLSGAIFELEKDIYDMYISSNQNQSKDLPYYNELFDLGFFSSKVDAKINNTNLTLVISLSELCNLNCYYCFENNNKKCHSNSNTYVDLLKLIDLYLSERTYISNVNIIWFGGEPMIEARKIKETSIRLIEICNKYNVIYTASIISNGTLFTNEFISDIDLLHIKNVQLTIDGGLDKFIDNKCGNMQLWDSFNYSLGKLCKKCIVKIRINLDKDNIFSVKRYLKKLQEIGVLNDVDISISRIETSNSFKQLSYCEFYSQKLDLFKYLLYNLRYKNNESLFNELSPIETACAIKSSRSIVVDSQGKCYKCEDDIGTDSIVKVTDIEACVKEIDTDTLQYDSRCHECIIYPLCKGGCSRHWDKDNCNIKIEYIKKLAYIKYIYSG